MLVSFAQERPHLSGSFHLYLRKTVHTRGLNFDKIYIRNSRKNLRIFHEQTTLSGQDNTNKLL